MQLGGGGDGWGGARHYGEDLDYVSPQRYHMSQDLILFQGNP